MIGSWVSAFERISDKFYSNFLLRDLVYIASGMLISIVAIVCTDMQTTFIESPVYVKNIMVIFCYFIGLLNQELMVAIGLFRMFPKRKGEKFTDQETDTILRIVTLINKNAEQKINDSYKRVERIFIIKNMMTAFGSSLLLSLIMLLSRYVNDYVFENIDSPLLSRKQYLGILFLFTTLLVGAIISNRRKAIVQDNLLKILGNIPPELQQVSNPDTTRNTINQTLPEPHTT